MIQTYSVYKVILENRRDCCKPRFENTEIRIGDIDANTAGDNTGPGNENPLCSQITYVPTNVTLEYPCPTDMNGRYIVARKFAPTVSSGSYLWNINEVRIFAYI